MGRIIAIDYGPKRVGIAATDPLKIIASPLTTLSPKETLEFLTQYIGENDVETIVVGMPRKMNGELSDNADGANKFAIKLQEKFPNCKIDFEDERFTSVIAHRAMVDGGVKKMDRRDKSLVDKTSASLILQSYLERK